MFPQQHVSLRGARKGSVLWLGPRNAPQACEHIARVHMPHLAPTGPGTSGPAQDRPHCSSSPLGRVCRSLGRRPPGTLAADHHSTPQGHTHPLGDGTAHRQASPAQQSRAHVLCKPSPWDPFPPTGLGAQDSPCSPGSRPLGHNGPPQPAGRWWRCSRGSDRSEGQK